MLGNLSHRWHLNPGLLVLWKAQDLPKASVQLSCLEPQVPPHCHFTLC